MDIDESHFWTTPANPSQGLLPESQISPSKEKKNLEESKRENETMSASSSQD